MSTIRSEVILRRDFLHQAVLTLRPVDMVVLVYLLATHTCSRTGRVWAKPGWIADRLRLTDELVKEILERIDRAHVISIFSVQGGLYGIEFGPLFVRDCDAPDNIPVEPPR